MNLKKEPLEAQLIIGAFENRYQGYTNCEKIQAVLDALLWRLCGYGINHTIKCILFDLGLTTKQGLTQRGKEYVCRFHLTPN